MQQTTGGCKSQYVRIVSFRRYDELVGYKMEMLMVAVAFYFLSSNKYAYNKWSDIFLLLFDSQGVDILFCIRTS